MHKGDTICITHAGRQYLVNVTDTKPEDQICVNETDLNTEFDPPLDYVEPKPVPLRPTKSTNERAAKAEDDKKVEEMVAKLTRLDGKPISEKQRQDLLKKIKEKEAEANLDFDPRKFKLKHGVRGADEGTKPVFGAKGTRL
jgi:hypothetical protein